MKKVILCFILLFSFTSIVSAEKLDVTLNKCVDGDTAWFNLNDEKIKTRFLAIDTPESTNNIEPYGKEASNFTCEKLKNAKKIEIEYDPNSDKLDKYDRHLVWVFVDSELLQDLIIKNGLGEVKYIYGDYKYTDTLKQSENEAKINHIGMWQEENNINYLYIIIVVIIFIIILIFSKSTRKKIISKTKKDIKKNIKKNLKIQKNSFY